MHLRFIISFFIAAFSTPIFAQGTNQPTVDELVAKNMEAKGGTTALNSLQTLRSTGKLLVPVQGVIELYRLPAKLVHLVLVNGHYIYPNARTTTHLKEGDVLALWPPIAGG